MSDIKTREIRFYVTVQEAEIDGRYNRPDELNRIAEHLRYELQKEFKYTVEGDEVLDWGWELMGVET